ncbi:hypothetical protein DL95DRAFT_90311 [Leptodontidium sp. 2 PMI_412]|nr:hypothetical protein DL95DRAFT_90311 [Leptodontidium sp. 2 PMI_412]
MGKDRLTQPTMACVSLYSIYSMAVANAYGNVVLVAAKDRKFGSVVMFVDFEDRPSGHYYYTPA